MFNITRSMRPDLPTIEAKLVKALLQADLISQEHVDDMSKVCYYICTLIRHIHSRLSIVTAHIL